MKKPVILTNLQYQKRIFLSWMSTRYNVNHSKIIRKLFVIFGMIAGKVPFSRGNYMTALIFSGNNLPPDIYNKNVGDS